MQIFDGMLASDFMQGVTRHCATLLMTAIVPTPGKCISKTCPPLVCEKEGGEGGERGGGVGLVFAFILRKHTHVETW